MEVTDSHPELVRKRALLTKCYERRKFAADCFLEHQKANHQSLYDFEIHEAEALFSEGSKRMLEQFSTTLCRKRQRCVNIRDQLQKELERRGDDEPQPHAGISLCLTEAEIREDLQKILSSLRDKARAFKKLDKHLDTKLVWRDGVVKLEFDKVLFGTGDVVSVFSRPLNRKFIATIHSMNSTQLKLIRKSGDQHDPPATLFVTLSELTAGRVMLVHV